jgi:hypothetical protein
MTSLLEADELVQRVESVRSYAVNLDQQVDRFYEIFLTIIELRGVFRGWLDELSVLDHP